MMTRVAITRCFVTALLLAGLGILAQAGPAGALELSVSPIKVSLAPNQKSAIIRVGNPNTEPLTVQVTIFTWSQDANGIDKLDPAPDLLAFPQMLQIKPGIERNIRVGTTNPDRTSERTYRIILEPVLMRKSANGEGGTSRGAASTIITRSSVPVFVEPTKSVPTPIKAAARVEQGTLALQISNSGLIHVPPPAVALKGYSANDELLFEQDTHGWYVLAASARTDRFRLPAEHCEKLQRLAVQVSNGQQTETLTVPVPPESCQRQP